jgi:hypothetical protein
VLTAEQMLGADVAAARDERRVEEGFISPADARAFLELARRGGSGDERDPITRAYFRRLRVATQEPGGSPKDAPGTALAAGADVSDLAALLREAEVIAPPAAAPVPLPALEPARRPGKRGSKRRRVRAVAPLFERAMSDLRRRYPERFSARVRELGYLVNVWLAGGAYEGRRPRPVEASEMVLRTCEAGLGRLAAGWPARAQALAMLARTPADTLFRRGFRARAPRRGSD